MARPDLQTQFAADALRKRIRHGDHAAYRLPGERQLALELGLSRQTVRRAIRLLAAEGVLARGETGRLRIASGGEQPGGSRRGIIAYVRPAAASYEIDRWRQDIEKAVATRHAVVRSIVYEHLNDTAISAALGGGFDGVFFHPSGARMAPWLTGRLRDVSTRVVVLDHDASPHGLRSVAVFPVAAGRKLLDHLARLGHRRIDCLNVQTHNSVIEARIGLWRTFLAEHRLAGTLYSPRALTLDAARDEVLARLGDSGGDPVGTAFFCTTLYAAIGGMRALHEAGLSIGRDVSVCAINDEGMAPFLIPSLTSLRSPSRVPYLGKAVDWMLGDTEWKTPSLLQPRTAPLFLGESTGPAPALPAVAARS
ncbi:GntR family transcriptional regulator [Opitutaceae bacterium TAV5]|nr:GntR family transcriptional regulator [Opitutaceae bacterium TAV5]